MAAQEKQRAECATAWQEAEQRQRERADAIVNHRLRHADIAYSFRPLSYWEIPGSALELVLRNVKGTRRREMIRDFYEQGRLDQLVPALAADELSDKDREGWAQSIHHLRGVNTSLAIVAMRLRSCESNSIRRHQTSSVYGPDRSAARDRG